MTFPVYPLLLASSTAAGTALNTSITRTSILHDTGKGVIAAGALQPGSFLKVCARGIISTFTSGTLTLDLSLAGTAISSFGALTLVASQTNINWDLEVWMHVRAVGASGTATVISTARFQSLVNSATVPSILLPASNFSSGTATTLDTSVANKVDLFATWSVTSASNSIQTTQSYTELKV